MGDIDDVAKPIAQFFLIRWIQSLTDGVCGLFGKKSKKEIKSTEKLINSISKAVKESK